MSLPLKNITNTIDNLAHAILLALLLFLSFQGPLGTSFWRLWDVLIDNVQICFRYSRVLEISMNFRVFSEMPQIEASQSGGGE